MFSYHFLEGVAGGPGGLMESPRKPTRSRLWVGIYLGSEEIAIPWWKAMIIASIHSSKRARIAETTCRTSGRWYQDGVVHALLSS